MINDRIDIAILLNIPRVQLGYRSADVRSVKEKFSYLHVGYSVHSLEEAIDAFKNGADSLVYGHVFPTDCKKVCQREGLKKFQTLQGVYPYRLQQLEESLRKTLEMFLLTASVVLLLCLGL